MNIYTITFNAKGVIEWAVVVVDFVDDVVDLLCIDVVHVADAGFVLVAIRIVRDVNRQVELPPVT